LDAPNRGQLRELCLTHKVAIDLPSSLSALIDGPDHQILPPPTVSGGIDFIDAGPIVISIRNKITAIIGVQL